jgi:hypothetical protein
MWAVVPVLAEGITLVLLWRLRSVQSPVGVRRYPHRSRGDHRVKAPSHSRSTTASAILNPASTTGSPSWPSPNAGGRPSYVAGFERNVQIGLGIAVVVYLLRVGSPAAAAG